MLRTCSRIIALTAMVAGPTAQAADTTLTLACQGTVTETMMGEEKKPEPISYKANPKAKSQKIWAALKADPVVLAERNAGIARRRAAKKQAEDR